MKIFVADGPAPPSTRRTTWPATAARSTPNSVIFATTAAISARITGAAGSEGARLKVEATLMDKRLEKRHKRQVQRAREHKKESEPDVRTPDQIKAAREAAHTFGDHR